VFAFVGSPLVGSLPRVTCPNGTLNLLTHSVASSCCTMSPALCGTMQCLSTAYVSHSSSNNDSSSSKSSDSRSDASAEVTKAVVTVTAIGSNTNWQYVQQHATGGAGLQPSFGNGEGIINRQSADDVCLFDLLACDASLICLAHFCM